jgi:hypothetical protein
MFVRGVTISLLVSLLLALGVGGCETRTVVAEKNRAAARHYPAVVVGDVTPRHPEWKRLVRFYKESLAQRLRESGAFDRVLYPAPVTLPPDAIVVEGEIESVDEGSELMRVLIGTDASRAVVEGQFRVVDGSDTVVAEFRQERVSNDANFREDQIYIEDLIGAFGRDTAAVVIRWSRGKDLEPDWPAVEWWDAIVDSFD